MSEVLPARIAVIGSGTMGSGIAQVFAAGGVQTFLVDIERELVERGRATIEKSLSRFVKKEKITSSEAAEILGRVVAETSIDCVADTDLVIEAVTEKVEVKKDVFRRADEIAPAGTILASNTSSISITELAAVTGRADKVIGMHFMNPVPLMVLVEVIRGQDTSDETTKAIVEQVAALGKTPVEANDYPGFISNRVLMPMVNEAAYCLMEGVSSREGIDQIMKLGMNHPMGPLTLADFIGLDVVVNILDVLKEGLGDDKYRACPLLRRMVAAGHLGRKTGEGFYTYD
ncbi:MAG: 3-hydroxybutyryl-CoA dehydrogenase [Planctomycetota bacterium]|jgi:3-hydroxybutyryl-CoA dehydrogenase|nr:3-hydroxybutyryl-CoA dehydrogenase [Planctomycetota bacterium]